LFRIRIRIRIRIVGRNRMVLGQRVEVF
jgi:hypothetical protein